MSDNGIKRQLKAIFSADVKGYSKLMGDDDEATVQTITALSMIALMEPVMIGVMVPFQSGQKAVLRAARNDGYLPPFILRF